MFTREWRYLLLIIVIFIAACIETDIYLPAFTDMMAYFSVSEEEIQGLLTWNFIGICISGLVYGPISDAVGRKKPLLVALGLFFAGSLITLFANTFELMLVGRVLQGLGSGGCFALGTAVLFDAFNEMDAIRALNRINSIVPFIMAAAPMLGGYLNSEYGFRSNFMAIAFFVLASLAICLFFFDETLPKEKRSPLNVKKILLDFKRVLLSVPFWQTTIIVCLLFGAYIAFLSGISVLYVIEYGMSKAALPFHQAALLGGWLVGSLTTRRAISRLGVQVVKRVGIVTFAVGGVVLVAAAYVAPESPLGFTVAMTIYSFGVNWVQGLYFPEGMALFPEVRGAAASLLTSARLFISAIVVWLASVLYDSTIYPIVAVVFSIVVIVLATIIFYERKKNTAMEVI